MKTATDRTMNASFFQRLEPGFKLALLSGFSILLFFINRLDVTVAALIIILFLYKAAGFFFMRAWQQIRPIWWLFVILFVLQLFVSHWQNSLVIVLRFASLLLLAGLVTLTTPVSLMMETLERSFHFLKPFGIHPAKISLALSLTLRFIPLLGQIIHDVHEARKARGLEGDIIAMAIPVIIRTLKMGEDVATAIEARCYDGDA